MNNELIELLNELFNVINRQKNIETDELVELEELLGLEPNPDNYPKYIEGIKDIRITRANFLSDFLSKISYGDIRLEADIIPRPSYTVVLDDLQPKLQDIAGFKITNKNEGGTVRNFLTRLTDEPYSAELPIEVFTEEEISAFTNIILQVTRKRSFKKPLVGELVSEVATTSATSITNRRKTYDHWKDMNTQFKLFIDALNDADFIEQMDELEEGEDELEKLTEIPSYIVRMGQVTLKKTIHPHSPMVANILRAKYIEKELQEVIESGSYREYSEEGKQAGDTGYIDTSKVEFITPLEQLRREISELTDSGENPYIRGSDIGIDPILSIVLQNEEFPLLLSEQQLQINVNNLVKNLTKEIPEENLEFTIDIIEDFAETIKEDLKHYEPIQRDIYHFAIMDGPEVSLKQVNFKDMEDATFKIDVAKKQNNQLVIEEVGFSSYSELVQYINSKTNILIKTLVEYFDVDAWAKTLADESEDPAYSLTFPETRPKDARAIGGGVVIPAYRRAESSEIKENLLDLSEQIQTYYYEGLTKQNVMFKDLPNFVKTPQYQALERELSGDITAKMAAALSTGRATPRYETDLFSNLNGFIKKLNRGELGSYSDDIHTECESFINSILTLFRPLERKELYDIKQNLSIVLGRILHGLFEDSNRSLEPSKFMGRTLEYWTNKHDEILEKGGKSPVLSFVKLGRTLENPKIKEYILTGTSISTTNKEGAAVDKTSRRDIAKIVYESPNSLMNNLVRVRENLGKSDALRKAIMNSHDLIRKGKKLPIHVGYLDSSSYTDNAYAIATIERIYGIDIYATDIDTIVKSNKTTKELVSYLGLPEEMVYHVRGLYR
jgi:hypothetical protein